MKIYLAGIPGGTISGEVNIIQKFERERVNRLLSFWNIVNKEFGADQIFNMRAYDKARLQ